MQERADGRDGPMGCGGSSMVAQTAPTRPIVSAGVSAGSPLAIKLAPGTADDSLDLTYHIAATNDPVIIQRRNHLPHNTVTNLAPDGSAPFTGAVAAPATTSFFDSTGKLAAVIQHDANGGACEATWADVGVGTGAKLMHAPAEGYRAGEGTSVLYVADESGTDGAVVAGVGLRPFGQIKPLMTQQQRMNAGFDYMFQGGVGLYPAKAGGAFAVEPTLKLTFGTKVHNDQKQCVGNCKAWYGDRPAPEKVEVAAGVEAVLVLALASEWDANRRGVRNYPIEAGGGMA